MVKHTYLYRHFKKAILFTLTACALLSPTISNAQANTKVRKVESKSPESISDVIVVTDSGNSRVIYLADEKTGAIYSHPFPSQSPASIRLTAFTLFIEFPQPTGPSSLAYQAGKLIVCDSQAATVYEIDINTRNHKVILKGSVLKEPTSVAVSETGVIAIADDKQDGIVWYEPGHEAEVIKKQADDPDSLTFNGKELLALDKETGTIFSITREDSQVKAEYSSTSSDGEEGKVKDFAFYMGTFFIVDGPQITALIRGGSKDNKQGNILPVPLKSAEQISPSQIAVTDEHLLIGDEKNKIIHILSRPIPVTINLEGKAEKMALALNTFYRQLTMANALPLYHHKVSESEANQSIETLLLKEHIIIPPPRNKESKDYKTARVLLGHLLCRLNPSRCQSQEIGDLLTKPVAKDEVLVLPKVYIENDLKSAKVNLIGDKTVEQYLNENIVSDKLRSLVDEKYLMRTNSSFFGTLEKDLIDQNFIVATPPTAKLPPGTILETDRGKDIITSSLSACGLDKGDLVVRPIKLSNTVSRSVLERIPQQGGNLVDRLEIEKLGIERIVFEFKDPKVESIDLDSLATRLGDKQTRDCLMRNSGTGVFLVSQALKVDGARLKLVGKDSLPVRLSEADLTRLGISGKPSADQAWSIDIDEPFYIGYRANALDENFILDISKVKQYVKPRQIKPDSRQNIFAENKGEVVLPFEVWRFRILTSLSDFQSGTSAIKKFDKAFTGVRVNRADELPTKSAAFTDLASTALTDEGDEDLKTVVRRNREELKKAINFTENLPQLDLSKVRIGIAEREGRIKFDHPDFIRAETSAWDVMLPNREVQARAIEKKNQISDPKDWKPLQKDDHGTHIAGILAAHKDSLTPGLLPDVRLFWVNTNYPDDLGIPLQEAADAGVSIFNFSITIPGGAASLMDEISNRRDKLFIVAAGNEGDDVKKFTEPPIVWADQLPNVIGVGGAVALSDSSKYLLQDWKDRDNSLQKGSNYHKQFVHIVAPARNIYSSSGIGSYAEATGTSQAAPLVTAAAAMLYAQRITEPSIIKARLLYTADWFSQLQDKVWAGALNIERAVWEIDKDLFKTSTNPKDKVKAVISFLNSPSITVSGGYIDDPIHDHPNVKRPTPPQSIQFQHIFRISRLPGKSKRYRVFYYDDKLNKLRIVMDTTLTGKLLCGKMQVWDGTAFKDPDESSTECKEGIDIGDVHEYVAPASKVPSRILF